MNGDADQDMNEGWDWAGPPLDTRPLFPLERAGFLGLLRGLETGDWQRPTVCPGWRGDYLGRSDSRVGCTEPGGRHPLTPDARDHPPGCRSAFSIHECSIISPLTGTATTQANRATAIAIMAMSVPEFSSATPTARLGSTTVAQAHALTSFLSLDTGTGSLPGCSVPG